MTYIIHTFLSDHFIKKVSEGQYAHSDTFLFN